jgi:hypothetical protein
MPRRVVNHLGVNMPVASEDRQTKSAVRVSPDAIADTKTASALPF